MHCMWSKWSPTSERSRLTAFALSGSYVGTVCTMCFGGIIGHLINWEAIFYIFGAAALIWSALWFTYIYESPSEHKTILLEEKLFVESSITHVSLGDSSFTGGFNSFEFPLFEACIQKYTMVKDNKITSSLGNYLCTFC